MAADADSGEAILGRMLQEMHRMAPDDLPAMLRHHAAGLGFHEITVYLADVQQRVLVELADLAPGDRPRRLPIDDSLAGWTYRTVSPRILRNDAGQLALWLPLLDGVERMGVIAFEAASLDAPRLDRCYSLASLVTLIVLDKSAYSDTLGRLQRVTPMRLPAEMVWAFLPPRTMGSDLVTSSAVLEPAYNLGGDSFDHSLTSGFLHTAIMDAMGHDLAAGLVSAVAMAGLRHARYSDADLPELVSGLDTAVNDAFADRHVTGVFAQLDLTTGRLTWMNAGHPPPLLLRHRETVPRALEREAEPPLGLGEGLPATRRHVHEAQLKPGDRVLLYTDGVPDARNAAGESFGEARFTDFVIRAIAAGEPAPEALRRLINAILDFQQAPLNDDATILLFEWHPFRDTATRHVFG
ncbi:PP2C family protein-serine/threonine phosphatase [Streptomyces sp. PU-14G]|uniref:PP2C family protein-serine/threonine phosphatase n=1 Tax=Streptomyces sp. PU-14G TaxID=2800808 RepID=UPI0034DED2BB